MYQTPSDKSGHIAMYNSSNLFQETEDTTNQQIIPYAEVDMSKKKKSKDDKQQKVCTCISKQSKFQNHFCAGGRCLLHKQVTSMFASLTRKTNTTFYACVNILYVDVCIDKQKWL